MTKTNQSKKREEEEAEKAELTDLKQFIRKKQLQNQVLKKISDELEDINSPINKVKNSKSVA
ncbi:MAG: hypothetical protein IPH88_08690 [Bacteroidales bacterium]|nr:hypothetical protein [Bacteroidales bacterium]